MAKPNPRIAAPFSEPSVIKIQKFQDSRHEHVYKCSNEEHTEPMLVSKLGLRCAASNCGYEQRWVHMFLQER